MLFFFFFLVTVNVSFILSFAFPALEILDLFSNSIPEINSFFFTPPLATMEDSDWCPSVSSVRVFFPHMGEGPR